VFNKLTELWGPGYQVLMAARFAHRSGNYAPTASHSQNKIKIIYFPITYNTFLYQNK